MRTTCHSVYVLTPVFALSHAIRPVAARTCESAKWLAYQSPEIVIVFIIIGVFGLSPVVGTSEMCGVCVLKSTHW